MRYPIAVLFLFFTFFTFSNDQSPLPNPNTTLVDSLNTKALDLNLVNADSAVLVIKKAIQIARRLKYKKGLGKGLVIQGLIHKNRGELENAYLAFTEGLFIRRQLGDSVGVASVYNNFSSLELMRNNFGNAIENSNKAIRIFRDSNRIFMLGRAYINLGNVYKAKEERSDAMAAYKKAEEQLTGDDYSLAIVKENLATIYTEDKNYSKALEYYFWALNTYIDYGDLQAQAQINNSIGDAHFRRGEVIQARTYFLKSAQQATQTKNPLLQGDAYANLGASYMNDIGNRIYVNRDSAVFYGTKLDQILEDSIGGIAEKGKAAFLFSNTYKAYHQYKKALEFLRLAYNYNDAAKEKKQAEKLVKERAKLDYFKQEVQIQKQQKMAIVLGIAILLCFLGLYFLLRKGRSKAKELKDLIETKDLEFLMAKLKGEQTGRDKIARELHDNVSPTTVAIKRELEIATKNSHDLEAMLASVNVAIGITDKVYEKTRQLAYELQTKPLEWLDDIQFDFNQLQRNEEIESKIIVHDIDESVDTKIGTEVSKILKVLLHNVRKHAKATKVSVDITRIVDELIIIIEDDGIGFNKQKEGLGLRSVKARIKDLKGQIDIDSTPGTGTTIIVNIPL